jgi:hypothetical protein
MDTPYQRDYLQITGVLTTAGALIFGLFFAARFAKRGVLPTDPRSLIVLAVLAALLAGGAALARARLWGGALVAAGYAAVAVWQLRLAIKGVHSLPVTRLLGMIALAVLLVVPAALVIRWRRFLR